MNERIDLLNREKFEDNVIKVVNQLSDIKRGCCFAIEGGWGIGKTFVIEKIEGKLNGIGNDRYFVFHYNCWQHDYYEEPAVAIISAMFASIKKDEVLVDEKAEKVIKAGYEFVGKELKKIAGLYIENKIGVNLISWVDDIKENKDKAESAEWEFDKMFNFSQTIEKVRKELQKIAKRRTIVLFVDELDRCIPQYAIKVLERLHHIFYGLNNVVVIIAIDRKQLEHSVEEMFGARKDESSIDIEKYLKKFIDFSLVLDNGVINESYWEKYDFYFSKFAIYDEYGKAKVTKVLQKLFAEVGIRRQEKIIEKANMVHSLVCNEKLDISVLIFEVMYEALKLWGFKDLRYVAVINLVNYNDIEEKIGISKIAFLKSFASEAYDSDEELYIRENTAGIIRSGLYARVFWYFANIFYDKKVSYIDKYNYMYHFKDELEVAKKYCEFCEIVK